MAECEEEGVPFVVPLNRYAQAEATALTTTEFGARLARQYGVHNGSHELAMLQVAELLPAAVQAVLTGVGPTTQFCTCRIPPVPLPYLTHPETDVHICVCELLLLADKLRHSV